jgi:O-antigen ligase
LGFYLFLIPFESIAVLGSGQHGTTLNWGIGATAAAALLGVGVVRKRLDFPSRPTLLWAAFLLWALLTYAWALDTQVLIKWVPSALALIALYTVASLWQVTEKQLKILILLIIAGGCAAALFLLYAYARGETYTNWSGVTGRASLILGGRQANPDQMGTDLLLPFALALTGFFSQARRLAKAASIAAAGVIGFAVFLTMSRSSLLAVGVIIGIFLLRLGWDRRILAVVVILGALSAALPGVFFQRLTTAVSTGGAGRLDIWEAGLACLRHYILTGAGLGNFTVAYTAFAGRAHSFAGYNRGSHNIYLEVGVELGVVGLALLAAAVISHLRTVTRVRTLLGRVPVNVVGCEAACWAMLVAGFFESNLWIKSFWAAWMMLLLVTRTTQQRAIAARTVGG